MASKVDIANMALLELGATPITAFTDDTTSGRRVSAAWNSVVDEVLSKGFWTTVTVRSQLAVLADAPTYEFDFQYQLPTNPYCLVVQSVSDGYSEVVEWRREKDKLLCYSETVYVKYTARITDTTVWGPHLTEAVSWGLVSRLARTITGSTMDAKYYRELADARISELLTQDNEQGTPELIMSSTLTGDIRD